MSLCTVCNKYCSPVDHIDKGKHGSGHKNCFKRATTKSQAKAAIEAYTAKREVAARLDELKHMPNHTEVNLYVRERIEALQKGNKDE